MENPNNYILDTDFLFALQQSSDSNHDRALKLLKELSLDESFVYVPNLVRYELATLVSRRISQEAASKILDEMTWQGFTILYVDIEVEKQIIELFQSYSKKNISFVDCTVLIFANKYNLKIVGFDAFYPSKLRAFNIN